MRYEDSIRAVADQIMREQKRAKKIESNPEEFRWYDEYATLNFFKYICLSIGNLSNGEIEKMVTRLKGLEKNAVEKHTRGAVWALTMIRCFWYYRKMKSVEKYVKRINAEAGCS